ncbi:uncharacterized protein ig2599ANME_0326 [groundwater metagenome]|nr:DUF2283 domain-containing protein [Euryarchaeota archaeon]MCG2728362.1 hypothetical protein [Candidatus Methanoperedenaceae archaeon]MCZ7392997.1 hypothetical protein [Candidatus Methanoperedens sp.]MCZ7395255.1 hypothetical protein [Candidatus Methanoperedens sp.]
MGKMNIWFDEEGDFLEITSIPSKKGFFKDVGNDIWERVDSTGNVLGFAILNFKKRFEKLKEESIELPVDILFAQAEA